MDWKPWRIGLILFVSSLIFFVFDPRPDQPQVGIMAAIAVLMAGLWMTEAIPMAATALIPIVALPLAGISSSSDVADAYMSSIIFLYVGGFLIALSMERWNLHRRIALSLINWIGRRADLLVLGFMVASALLSMWISNTATAVMMLPIGLAIVSKMENEFGVEKAHPLALTLMLGIAYACSIGGVATLVGTPTNLAFIQNMEQLFPDGPIMTFGQWLIIGLPFSCLMLGLSWLLLTRVISRIDVNMTLDRSIVKRELAALGPFRHEEKVVLAVFLTTVFAWTFRRDLNLGIAVLPGWSNLWPGFGRIDDGTIAVFCSILLFFIPSRDPEKPGKILESDVFSKVPWGIVLLFGGGFALAGGFRESGLSQYLGESFQSLGSLPTPVLILIICVFVSFLTELTSNVATLSMLLPILTSWAVSLELNPLLFAIPATISASMAFMMPVATPPNAVVFGSQRIRIAEMARHGVLLNLLGIVLTTLATLLLFRLVTGSDPSSFPTWATPAP